MNIYQIKLKNTPNQKFSFQVGDDTIAIQLRYIKKNLYVDINLNGIDILTGFLIKLNMDIFRTISNTIGMRSLIFSCDDTNYVIDYKTLENNVEIIYVTI